MCFNTSPSQTIAKTATKDIECYKIFKRSLTTNTITSPYRGNRWSKGRIKSAPLMPTGDNNIQVQYGTISSGLHSFRDITAAIDYRGHDFPRLGIYRCIIPKGARYWTNATQHVSDKLYIKSITPVSNGKRK